MAIQCSEDVKEVLAALARAKADMGAVAKGGENTFDKYKYSKLEDYHKVVSGPCANHGLVIVEGSSDHAFVDGGRETSKGKHENACRETWTLRVYHVASGQWIETTVDGEGQDRADKATYKAHTGARKYARAAMFDLITTDDPEADEGVGGVTDNTKPPKASDAQVDTDFDF